MREQITTNKNYKLTFIPNMSMEGMLEEMGHLFQNLRHLKAWSRTVENGGWRARGFTKKAPHHHVTVNGRTPKEAVYNLLLEVLQEKK